MKCRRIRPWLAILLAAAGLFSVAAADRSPAAGTAADTVLVKVPNVRGQELGLARQALTLLDLRAEWGTFYITQRNWHDESPAVDSLHAVAAARRDARRRRLGCLLDLGPGERRHEDRQDARRA